MIKYVNNIRFEIEYIEKEESNERVYLSLTNDRVKLRLPACYFDKTSLYIDKVKKILKIFPKVKEPYHLKSNFNYNATVFKFFNEDIPKHPKNIKIRLNENPSYVETKIIKLNNDKQLELLYTTGKKNRLTVTPNRATLKLMESARSKEAEYVKKAADVIDRFPEIKISYRTQPDFSLNRLVYVFRNDSNTHHLKIVM